LGVDQPLVSPLDIVIEEDALLLNLGDHKGLY
jgi:hypothetical protein